MFELVTVRSHLIRPLRRCFSSSPAWNAERKPFFAVIMGPPGSGKGTISERIIRDFKFQYLSAGDMLRSHIARKTEFGVRIQTLVATGKLVPSELLVPLVESEIEKLKSSATTGILLDGFPRSLDQAESLHSKNPPDVAIQLDVPFTTIIDRIKSRWIHLPSGRVYNLEFNAPKIAGKDDQTGEDLTQRDDDKPEFVQKRLEIYQNVMDPILEFYKAQNVLQVFSGTESNVIYPQVKKFLESTLKQ